MNRRLQNETLNHRLQDETLWTKATWSVYKLQFPRLAFGDGSAALNAAPTNGSAAEGASVQASDGAAASRIPRDAGGKLLEAQLRGYEAVSLGGVVPGSGGGAPHEGLRLPDT